MFSKRKITIICLAASIALIADGCKEGSGPAATTSGRAGACPGACPAGRAGCGAVQR